MAYDPRALLGAKKTRRPWRIAVLGVSIMKKHL